MCSQLYYKIADGSSSEYLWELLGFHDAEGKSLETKRCWQKNRAKKDKRMRAVFPGKRTGEKAGTLCRTFFSTLYKLQISK